GAEAIGPMAARPGPGARPPPAALAVGLREARRRQGRMARGHRPGADDRHRPPPRRARDHEEAGRRARWPGAVAPGRPPHPRRGDRADTLSWLRRAEVANTPAAILAALRRRATLVGWGVDRWDLQALHPNRLKLLA